MRTSTNDFARKINEIIDSINEALDLLAEGNFQEALEFLRDAKLLLKFRIEDLEEFLEELEEGEK